MRDRGVATRYAQALLEAGRAEGVLAELADSYAGVVRVMREHPDLPSFLEGPHVAEDEKKHLIRGLFEGQDGRGFEALITYHSYSQLVLYPWGYTYSPPPDADLLSGITQASNEQAEGVEQINTAVSQMDKVTQQNAAGAEESASASEELSAQSEELRRTVLDLQSLVGGRAAGTTSPSATASAAWLKIVRSI